MTCPRCRTVYPSADGRAPRLHCDRCGARLFAWLGDPFGARDAATIATPTGAGMARTPPGGAGSGGIDRGAILLLFLPLALAVFLLLSCVCLAVLAR